MGKIRYVYVIISQEVRSQTANLRSCQVTSGTEFGKTFQLFQEVRSQIISGRDFRFRFISDKSDFRLLLVQISVKIPDSRFQAWFRVTSGKSDFRLFQAKGVPGKISLTQDFWVFYISCHLLAPLRALWGNVKGFKSTGSRPTFFLLT